MDAFLPYSEVEQSEITLFWYPVSIWSIKGTRSESKLPKKCITANVDFILIWDTWPANCKQFLRCNCDFNLHAFPCGYLPGCCTFIHLWCHLTQQGKVPPNPYGFTGSSNCHSSSSHPNENPQLSSKFTL